jgi:hypothetical protein
MMFPNNSAYTPVYKKLLSCSFQTAKIAFLVND